MEQLIRAYGGLRRRHFEVGRSRGRDLLYRGSVSRLSGESIADSCPQYTIVGAVY